MHKNIVPLNLIKVPDKLTDVDIHTKCNPFKKFKVIYSYFKSALILLSLH